jgi:hypothetical protein
MGQSHSQPQVVGYRLSPTKNTNGILDKCVLLREGSPTVLILFKNGVSYSQRHATWELGIEALKTYTDEGYVLMKKKDLKLTTKKGFEGNLH